MLLSRARADEDADAKTDMSALPSMSIRFFEYFRGDIDRLMLTEDFWTRRWKEHYQELRDQAPHGPRREPQGQAAGFVTRNRAAVTANASDSALSAAAMAAEPEHGTALKPPWLLNIFQQIRFCDKAKSSRAAAAEQAVTPPQALIYWGRPEDITSSSTGYI
jgi:hypothetical protein